ncbi:MAG: hypothetical protein WC346_22110 [Methanogenium sp.]|jgi:hypothetical protein
MKKLTEAEFRDRTLAVLRANKIFIDSNVTNNVSIAFELYQKVCAEREREIFLSTKYYGNKPRTVMDAYERPKCPDCNTDMAFRAVPENEEGTKMQLVCTNPECNVVLNSEHDLDWWRTNLRRIPEDEYDRVPEGVAEIKQIG